MSNMTSKKEKNARSNERIGILLGLFVGDVTWGMWKGLFIIPIRELEFAIGVPLLILGGVLVAWGALFYIFEFLPRFNPFPKVFVRFVYAFVFVVGALDLLWSLANGGIPL